MALYQVAILTLLGHAWAQSYPGYGYGGHPKKSIYPWPPVHDVRVRLPPTLLGSSASGHASAAAKVWIPAPTGFQYGHWWVTHSSNPDYAGLYNFQHDAYPPIPPAYPGIETVTGATLNASAPPVVDLTSFNLPEAAVPAGADPATVYTAFGYDFPRTGEEWVFDFHGTGRLNATGNTWELLAWGYDSTGAAYTLIYETAVPGGQAPGLDVECRAKGGPAGDTIAVLVAKVKKLGNKALSKLADELVLLPTDGRRDGLPPVACPESCIDNDNVPGV